MTDPIPVPGNDPKAEYTRRLEVWKAEGALCERRHRRLGVASLALGGVTIVIIGLALGFKLIPVFWVAAPVAAIVVLAVLHGRVLKNLRLCGRAMAFYERGLARIEHRWTGTGETGAQFSSDAHPYSRDLDLFGDGSLFQLLCSARTHTGQETLARWLLLPAAPDVVRGRQAAVTDLRTRLSMREALAVIADEVPSAASSEVLARWGEGKSLLPARPLRIASLVLASLWVAAIVVWIVWETAFPALLISAVNLGLSLRYRRRVGTVASAVEGAARDLALLAGVLERFEAEQFTAPLLRDLQSALNSRGESPSRSIARLNRLMEYLDSRRNLIVKALDPFVLWTMQGACGIETWRERTGPALRRWLAAMGELEALASLAGYAYEHSTDVFPEFTEASPCLEAEGFAHPLLPEGAAVRNDLCFTKDLRVVVISGPNMAGKSTLVRAVGLNVVLAQCGAPVRARRLRLSPLAVGASICILDSLQGGISRFYTEIRRLKQIVDLTHGSTSVLFLLDEFLQGTNSHDRQVGSEAMVRNLVERGALGLVTTHDLALAQIAERLGPRAANAHFEDRLENGKLVFDYRLQPGIVHTSNALDLMRSLGLDV